MAGASSSTRGLFLGGNPDRTAIEFVTIATTGDAQDFGDLTVGKSRNTACSNGHGGL